MPGLLIQALPAQQWTSYLSPPYPPINLGLRSVGNTVFFNAETGLYRSSDGGDHWERIRDYQLTDVFQVFEVNRNNHHLYYSQGIDSSGHWELYKSADLGDTWSLIGNVQASVLAFIGDTVYGGCFNQDVNKLCSKRGGQDWKPVQNFPKDTYWLGLGISGVLRKKPESPKWTLGNSRKGLLGKIT